MIALDLVTFAVIGVTFAELLDRENCGVSLIVQKLRHHLVGWGLILSRHRLSIRFWGRCLGSRNASSDMACAFHWKRYQ